MKKKYRNQEPRPAHLKPPLAESPFGQFPASYHMRDTWSGNKTCRYRDRKAETVKAAAKDPVSYLNRSLPKRIQRSMSKDVLKKSMSMTQLLKSQSAATLLSPVKTGGGGEDGESKFAKKFTDKGDDDEVRQTHTQQTMVSASSPFLTSTCALPHSSPFTCALPSTSTEAPLSTSHPPGLSPPLSAEL